MANQFNVKQTLQTEWEFVKTKNPITILLNYLFPAPAGAPNASKADTSPIDPVTGLSAAQIKQYAAQADQYFAQVIGAAGTAAGAALAPEGTPFVAAAVAAIVAFWKSLPDEKKAAIVSGKG